MRIKRLIINAAIGATLDRRFISKASKAKLDRVDLQYYKKLEQVSGPSVHNPVKVLRNWNLAFKDNLKRQRYIESMNVPFKQKSNISTGLNRIFHRTTNKV